MTVHDIRGIEFVGTYNMQIRESRLLDIAHEVIYGRVYWILGGFELASISVTLCMYDK